MSRRRVLIEEWLPIAQIGAESRRERGAVSALPPIYFLHVWWARRPLMVSRAAVLASLLPTWSEDFPEDLLRLFPTEDDYRDWFADLLGISGDPAQTRRQLLEARARGVRVAQGYEGPRAFTVGPDRRQVSVLRRLLKEAWGTEHPTLLDPMAGGGSIPFEALRFGLETRASELNPVASLVLEGTLSLPAAFGPGMAQDVDRWGQLWAERVNERLGSFFTHDSEESVQAYLFARTVACPDTGKPVPLTPNWWLRRGADPVAVRVLTNPDLAECRFEVARDDSIDFDPDEGTVKRGEGRSPWTGTTISGEYIKNEAQAGRMGSQLYAVITKDGQGNRHFRVPNGSDLAALELAEREMSARRKDWQKDGLIPDEDIPPGSKTAEPLRYGMANWADLFSPRQLLTLGTAVEELRRLRQEMQTQLDPAAADGVITYLAMALDKVADYNCRLTVWHPGRSIVAHVFQRHDLAMKWSFAEMMPIGPLSGIRWSVRQVSKAARQLCELIEPSRAALFETHPEKAADLIEVLRSDAASLPFESESLYAVVMDPPYYDNVQYAELSDFFFVWEKLTVGQIYPQFFEHDLTDKAQEAVANPSRFEALDRRRSRDLAKADYERKMTRIFAETNRILRPEGVLTVMFTHKRVEAWDTLGHSLIEAGFEIESSWPIHSESEHSLHQAKKAAASSTILLSCRKRPQDRDPAWWDDLKADVRKVARDRAEEFAAAGIDGVDLYISTFGPTLAVISRQWPVFTSDVDPETGEPRPLRPEEALDLAREEVADLRRQGLLLGRDVEFDPATDWYLLSWDAFGAIEFPYDEARKLALAMGVDLDSELIASRIVAKKGSSVILQEPKQRRRPGLADPEDSSFARLVDAAHALMVAYQEDGIRGAESFLKRTRLSTDARFLALVQAMVNAIPRTKLKGKFVRPEAAALDGVVVLFPDLVIPEEPGIVLEASQGALDFGAANEADENERTEDDGDDEGQ